MQTSRLRFALALGTALALAGAASAQMPAKPMKAPSGAAKAVPPPPADPMAGMAMPPKPATAAAPAAPVVPVIVKPIARATIIGADRKPLGEAVFREGPTGVMMRVELTGGLPPGWHGMHFHAVGTCEDAAFTKAGAHVNHTDPATKKGHGLLSATGPDFGDLANIYTAADGTTHGEVFSSLVTLTGAAGREMLFDADGTSVIFHANADDHATQPIGGAGGRIACGVIEKLP